MTDGCIEQVNSCYRIAGTRVSLDSVVYAFLDGDSPEDIAQSFPLLTLEQVYGAIAYYLSHREEVDAHLREEDSEFEMLKQTWRQQNPQLAEKLDHARRALLIPSMKIRFQADADLNQKIVSATIRLQAD